VHHYTTHSNQNIRTGYQSRAHAWSGYAKRISALAGNITATLIFTASLTSPIHAAPGDLDPTFNPTGSLPGTLSRASSKDYDRENRVLIQPDGKLLIAGTRNARSLTTATNFEIWRYNPDGTPDTTFANAGLLQFTVNTADKFEEVADVVLLPDGRFVVGSTCKMPHVNGSNDDFCLVRFKPDGSIDSTFGTNGIVTAEIGAGDDTLKAIALQIDGKIVAAGACGTPTGTGACVARFLENGSLDTAFGTGGKFTQQLATRHLVESAKLQSDGRIVFAGTCGSGVTYPDVCVTRLTSTGALDPTFNSTGNRTVRFVGGFIDYEIDALPTPLLIQPDGRIIVGAVCLESVVGVGYMCIAKLNANGTYVATFGSSNSTESAGIVGRMAYGSPDGPILNAVLLQPDGKLVLSGDCGDLFCMVRIFDNGSRDPTFGAGSYATVEIVTGNGSVNYPGDAAIDRDGRIVVTGECIDPDSAIPPNEDRLCIARLDGGTSAARNCNLDIDGDGQVFSSTDALIMSRASAKVAGSAIIGGITFPPNATRNTWPLVRDYLVQQCGMSVAP
jgi:uncharacterized delta-60 repeat protein